MNDRHNMTLMNDGAWGRGASHRRGSFKKVENGYVLKLLVSKLVKADPRNDMPERHHMEEREYIYYTVEEFVMALTNYLNADAGDLVEGSDD